MSCCLNHRCIIPSKVPLGESYNDCVPPSKRYSFKQAVHKQEVLGRKLGLVIDLTNTSRYYQTTDLKKKGIKHVKIQCKGRDAVPENGSINTFVYENTLIQDGKEMALVLYTYRSCVKALPQGVCWNSQFGIQKLSAETGAASIYCGFWF
ncbi:hypothetical protein GOBAR_AA17984 [Gossypium barbadense]|uniref:Uncharacterized protein n=1 Tax=Gossypium barbadense TaxID=3634 RepID=A0A2P5XH36_GOSBA|nr:hypothetical protein GOBAR_AA17984 [Gossypium barbadense]